MAHMNSCEAISIFTSGDTECRDFDAMLGIAPLTSKIRMIP